MLQPLNQRIKEYIQEMIDSGRWQVGERIPSENELGKIFNASRMTVNRAVKELTELGRLSRVQGLGTYVARFVATAPLFEIQSIRKEIESRGKTYDCSVLAVETRDLCVEKSARTGIEPGEQYYLEVVHRADGQPLQLERRYVNSKIAPAFITQDFTETTGSDYLLRHVPYTEVRHRVEAISADGEVSAHLKLSMGDPCLRLTRQTLSHDRVITHVELIHPGDQFSLSGSFAGSTAKSQVA